MLKPSRVLVTPVSLALKNTGPLCLTRLSPESSPVCSAFTDFSLSCTGECSLGCAILHIHRGISLIFRIDYVVLIDAIR